MTRRGFALLSALAAALLCALALGGRLYYYISILLLLLLAYGLLSSLLALATLECAQRLSGTKVHRGENVSLTVTLRHCSLLPIAPVEGVYWDAGQENSCVFPAMPFVSHTLRLPLSARHVGQYSVALNQVTVSDLFGLFSWHKCPKNGGAVLMVLPRPFAIDKPKFNLGDDGAAALSRTQEDYNSPEDVRPYRPGDAMKRVHWKLSSRKQELWVRRFETPAPPDTLILLDCAQPLGGAEKPEGTESLRDALCETAVAVAKLQMADGSPVRLPLYGERANEFASDHAGNLALLQEMLAAQPFRKGEDFSRVLNLELRRMRRTGAAIIITTRLSAPIVEGISRMRRMGPSARLYLVTYTPDSPEYQPYVARLQHHLVEVCYVTPA